MPVIGGAGRSSSQALESRDPRTVFGGTLWGQSEERSSFPHYTSGVSFKAMKHEDQELDALRQMADDPKTPSHLRLGALKELARLRERETPVRFEGDPLGAMREVVEKFCPETDYTKGMPADPQRGLDFEAFVGRKADVIFLSWAPYCPSAPERAERAVVAAARRLGVGTGPYEVPERQDELALHRHKKAS
jgi:hypothetical protein